MCGVIAAAGRLDLTPATAALAHRGPDSTATATVGEVSLGHTRLAIRDLSAASRQPFRWHDLVLAYNGELFNAAEVRAAVARVIPSVEWRTTGDTEVVAAALAVLGPARALPLLDGMFAMAWTVGDSVLHLARDRQGEIPLHVHQARPILAASELKAFTALGRRCGPAVADVGAGQWWEILPGHRVRRHAFHTLAPHPAEHTLTTAVPALASALCAAVDRRAISDVPICSLLSGGIDSAAIALELSRHVSGLVCYTARFDPRSRDLRCAREAADMIGTKLVEVDIPCPTTDDLSRVIGHIEMDYKAQIEIGWPCLQLAAAMRSDGFRVTYSGEGSDELWASYGFAYHGLRKQDWFTYRRDLIAAQARKNFPRVNKAFMAHGIEARLPFLDPGVVDLALSLPRGAVQDGTARPKAVLQRAYAGRLPRTVITRPKVAFQDGLGLKAAIARSLPDPLRYYRAECARLYG